MSRVRIGPAFPDRKKLEAEIARLRDLDNGVFGKIGMLRLGGGRLLTYPAISCFASWLTGCRPTCSVT